MLSFPFYPFVFTSAENASLLPGLYMRRSSRLQSNENIITEGQSGTKAAKKDPSATALTSIHLTGATVLGSINATEFWQRLTQFPSFLLLLSCKMDLAIPHWSTLRPGSQTIYYNFHFCNNYFCTCFLQWCAVFHQNNLERNLGCTMTVPMQPSYSITFCCLFIILVYAVCILHTTDAKDMFYIGWCKSLKGSVTPAGLFHLCLEKSALLYDFFHSAFILDLLASIWQSFSSYPVQTKLSASNEETLKLAE